MKPFLKSGWCCVGFSEHLNLHPLLINKDNAMSETDPIDFPIEADRKAALEEFDAQMRTAHAHLKSVSREELDAALSKVTEFLRINWTTGGGRHLRHFVWSLWNGWHLVNLFDLSHGLDTTLTDAVVTLFRAAMLGALTEDHLRCLLAESGEMRRWQEAQQKTPEGFEVLYPPPPLDADALRRLAEAATRLEQLEDDSFSLEEP
jgi:hypothetical protein